MAYCKYSGVLYLYNEKGICLTERRYQSRNRRRKYLMEWSEFYKDRRPSMFYQIAPDIKLSKRERSSLAETINQ